MTGEPEKEKNIQKKFSTSLTIGLLLLLALAAFGLGYGVIASGLGQKTVEAFRLWTGAGEPVVAPPDDTDLCEPGDTDEKTPDPDAPREEPAEPGEPGGEPREPGEETEGADTPEDPVIYAGQVLVIPMAEGGGGGISTSRVVQSGTLPSAEKRIALTFDSGWETRQTIPMLDILEQYNVTATFFPRALWVQDNPGLAREIVRRGHTVGNHSLTHPHMRDMTADQIRHEIRESTRIIQEVTGVKPFMFRPPYGEYNQQILDILAQEGYPYTVMWTVDTIDWAAGTTRTIGGSSVYIDTDFIVSRVLNNAGNNGIVLMHIMDRSDTTEALPRIIEGLRDMGYGFATVDEMLPAPAGGTVTHTVKSGDTLFSLAQKYGVSVQQIIKANDL